jgi:hypothetical protein
MLVRAAVCLSALSGAGGALGAECGRGPIALAAPSKAVAATLAEGITSKMSVRVIIKILGPPARDVGSGRFVLQWDLDDGRIFYVSTPDTCGKPVKTGFVEPAAGGR